MATNRKKAADPALLTTDLATIYTVPDKTAAKDITFDFFNSDTSAAIGVTLHLVPYGTTASATNQLFSETSPNGMTIGPGEWRSVPIDQAMSAGDFIQAKASTTAKLAIHTTVTEVV